MKGVQDKGCYNNYTPEEIHHRSKPITSRSKQTPSKWDDAQKWLSGFNNTTKTTTITTTTKPRNSNADDRRLLSCPSQKHRDSCSSVEAALDDFASALAIVETKKIDFGKPSITDGSSPPIVVRSVCLRDMGTEMTPIASQEPTPVARSPIVSRSNTPVRRRRGGAGGEEIVDKKGDGVIDVVKEDGLTVINSSSRDGDREHSVIKISSSLESRAMAWDEAERAKYMARYKREEVKIQAWENHEKRKAEMEMKRLEVKAERMKARAQEKLTNKLAATKRIADEKRASAEAKLNERAGRTSERADYIRRTGRMPSSFFSFKMPSLCD